MGHEGPRQRAAGNRVQDRCLYLEETELVEVAADLANDRRADLELAAHVVVGEEIHVAHAVTRFDIDEAVELLGRIAQRLGQ